jgi:hypothetical protein
MRQDLQDNPVKSCKSCDHVPSLRRRLRANSISTNLTTRIQIKRCRESRDHVSRVMHTQVNPRQANQ